jgi:hypothetical protein
MVEIDSDSPNLNLRKDEQRIETDERNDREME